MAFARFALEPAPLCERKPRRSSEHHFAVFLAFTVLGRALNIQLLRRPYRPSSLSPGRGMPAGNAVQHDNI